MQVRSSRHWTKWKALLLLLITTSLVASACGSDEEDGASASAPATTAAGSSEPEANPLEDLIAAAEAEGKMTLYSADSPESTQKAADAFSAQYGIEVEVLRQVGIETRYAPEAEAGNVVADAMLFESPAFAADATSKGWFAEISSDLLPEELPAEAWRETYGVYKVLPLGFVYNTDTVDEANAPETFEDVLDPQFKGRIVYSDPRNADSLLGNVNYWYNQFGPEFLEGLRAQEPELVTSVVAGIQRLVAGEFDIAMVSIPSNTLELEAQGAPVENVFPDDTSGFEFYVSASADSPSPNAGKLFVHWLLSEEGQKVITAGQGASPLGDLEGAFDLPANFTAIDVEEARSRRAELLSLLGLG